MLSRLDSLESITLEACAGVTNAGIAMLASLPNLKLLSVALMSGVSRQAIDAMPDEVQVEYEP